MKDASGITLHLAVGIGKDRNIYLVNRDEMGKFNAKGNQNIYQELPIALKGEKYRGSPVYFDGRLYAASVKDAIVEFRFVDAKLIAEPVSSTATRFDYPGAMPSISADGTRNGIVWAAENAKPAVLHAYERTIWLMNSTTATKHLRGEIILVKATSSSLL